MIIQGWRITISKTSVAQDPKALSDYNPAYQHGKPEVPKLLARLSGDGFSTEVYDYIDESKIHPLLPREIHLTAIGSEHGLSAPRETNAVDLYRKLE